MNSLQRTLRPYVCPRKSVKLFAFLLTSLALSACQHNPPKPDKVVVSEPCIQEVPVAPAECVPKDTSRQEWLRCELVMGAKLRGYVVELEAVVKGCAK